MKLYIAASSRETARVRAAQCMVAQQDWILTLDWLTEIENNLCRGIKDSDLSTADQARHARADFDAVREADVVWLLAPQEPTKGAWVELGYALGIGKPVIVSGPASKSSIFLTHCFAQAASDSDAIETLRSLARTVFR